MRRDSSSPPGPAGSPASGPPPRQAARRRGLAARLGSWSTRHRGTAIAGWLLFVVLAAAVGGMAGVAEVSQSESETGDSARATRILEDAGIEEPAGEMVMVAGGTRDGWRPVAREVAEAVEATGEVRGMRPAVPSEDGTAGLLNFRMKGDPETAGDRVQPVVDAVEKVRAAHRGEGVELHQYGQASADRWLGEMLSDDFAKAEWTAVPLALGILLVAFGALVAALLPVALAVTAFVAANGLLALASHQLHIFDTTSSVMLLMGLAVGIDYCLFYLRRERDERAAGRDAETALRVAAATSGRAVLVSGLTVMVAMAGLFLSGLLMFEGFAVAVILVVLIAMLGSVTILPALLSWLGDRVERGRLPWRRRTGEAARHSRKGASVRESGRVSAAVLRPVLAAPGVFAVLATVAMLALAAPALGIRTEQLALDKQMPSESPLRISSEAISETFPGGPAPARVVVKTRDAEAPAVRQALADFTRQARADKSFGQDVKTAVHRGPDVVQVLVPLSGDGSDAASKAAVDKLRDSLVPRTLEPVAEDSKAYVGGETASSMDFNDQLGRGIVPVLLFITAVTFLLMLVCFRSLPVAAASVVLNLLSVGAAYGVMTAVFQHGWGAELLGTEAVGAIESWMPLFVLVVLFGLSMDYHVFVVSRIREAHDRGAETKDAIREGVRATAGAVTGAAVIMVAVFAVFGTLSMQDMQQMGVGLAVAVLLDATVVRMVLLPAVMTLLGERNWYLPRWLRRLPDLEGGGPLPSAGSEAGGLAAHGAAGPVPHAGGRPGEGSGRPPVPAGRR
ncbi:putative drug exporter of the RND superfamily [Streptomyces sp. WMMB 714]|uniref:MMPL family transporter n=1 Tax=Streptomyces sp. WMMB 714 TaxID=1286822 RepID=UPI00082399D5|nr:MMPL family transporter [Streptomyces sp. WMMB 714]SCK16906.1 putative drug exporter of the RND superfamily [Streptomyces sp. WMMB 714]